MLLKKVNPYAHRWIIVAVIVIAIICNYLDRQLLSILKPEILSHFNIGDVEFAWILNVFLICYAVMYPISGWLVDKFGPKPVMMAGIVAWSIACIGGGIATDVYTFAVCRGVLGLAEPTIFTGQLVAVTLWFDKKSRATANSICQAGGSFGTMCAPLLIAWLTRFLPWQEVFIVAGVIGLVIAVIWWATYSRPSDDYLKITLDEPKNANVENQPAFSFFGLFTTTALWGAILIRLVSDPVWYFINFWLPGFLRDLGQEQGLSPQATLDMIQYIGGIPFLVGATCGVLASAYSDKLVARGWKALKSRKAVMMGAACLAPVIALVPFFSHWQAVSFNVRLVLVTAVFTVVAFMCLVWLYNIGMVIADTVPVKNVASVLGLACGSGAVGASIFNLVVGNLMATMGDLLFYCMAFLHPIAALVLYKLCKPAIPGKPVEKKIDDDDDVAGVQLA